jgi:hypothetical protein
MCGTWPITGEEERGSVMKEYISIAAHSAAVGREALRIQYRLYSW